MIGSKKEQDEIFRGCTAAKRRLEAVRTDSPTSILIPNRKMPQPHSCPLAIISILGDPAAVSAAIGGLAPQGRMVVLGAGKEPAHFSAGFIVGGERSVLGSITGSPYENEKALNFAVLTGARPLIEKMPLERANEAYRRMRSGDVKFRMVLTMCSPA